MSRNKLKWKENVERAKTATSSELGNVYKTYVKVLCKIIIRTRIANGHIDIDDRTLTMGGYISFFQT